LRFEQLPRLIARSGILYNQLSSGVNTNMNIDQLVRLAWTASQIPEDQIKKGIIGPPDQVSFAVSPDGEQQVLKPITDKIRQLRDEIFATMPISPVVLNLSQPEIMQADGLAANTAEFLKSQGINVTETGNAQTAPPSTEVTFFNGKPHTVRFLVDTMNINPLRIFYVNDPASTVDVQVTLGNDWAQSNPMP
jgi:hypothetical protein